MTGPFERARSTTFEEARIDLLLIPLDRGLRRPLRAQLVDGLRDAIRTGRLADGERLPSTRSLAEALGVSRGVVEDAYAQVATEGWLELRHRARPVVRAGRVASAEEPPPREAPTLHDLSANSPDLSLFPRAAWAAAHRDVLRRAPDAALGYGDPAGPRAFREAVAGRQARVRGMVCDPAAIVATSGFTQSVDLVARTLVRLGARRVAVEDPGFDEQRVTLARAGLEVVPVGVDAEGIRSADVAALDPDAVVVTPSHQFPTGVVLSAGRRRTLVEWARARERLIVEDDYDAEFRHDRRPVGALQGLAPDHVVALGTTAKSLAPALRIGWLVAPPRLVGPLLETRYETDVMPATLPLLALAALIEDGRLDRHLRRCRRVYGARRSALLHALDGHVVTGAAAGLHVVLELPDGVDEQVRASLAAERVRVRTLAGYTFDAANRRSGLVIGYGRLPEPAIPDAVALLERAIGAGAAG